ncbi:MAG: 3-methyl-2-oxobutanoate dehydrogenase subunit beta [Candidatus Cloacimonetes bacterium]|nr:3-methyl-2-oxobutanoate dehydrogenase subunit beta [Candidatus Cloacimonadota bacterium]
MKLTIPEREIMQPGHLACQGCGASMAMRYALKIFGRDSVLTIPACCWAVIDGPFPYTAVNVPLFHTAFETAAVMASGIKAGLDVQGKKSTNVIAWAGDGGTFDIGIQAISGAAERNDDITYIVYDNEAYMNTGIQRSSATPHGAWTTTTPIKHYKIGAKKNMVEIMSAHRIPYAATASVAYPEDLCKKLEKAKNIRGFKFIHILAPCPTGWKSDPKYTVKLAKLAVQTNIFPIYEIENGLKYTQNKKVKQRKPITEYFKYQGRFKHLKKKEVEFIQKSIDRENEILLKKF